MATVVEASGTYATEPGVEGTLATLTEGKVYQLQLDLAGRAGGDAFAVAGKTRILAGGALRTVWREVVYAGQLDAGGGLWTAIPLIGDSDAQAVVFTLQQLRGSAKAVPWKVLSL
ncbi:MAG: hypothetical protein ACM3S1_04060 [Hyphomicrobiales bacterium]